MSHTDFCLLGFGENGWPKVRPTAEKIAASLSSRVSPPREEFELTWCQFLRELKSFLDAQPDYHGNRRTVAEQAELFEAGVRFVLSEIRCVTPSLKMSDRLFSEVFGFAGKLIINEKEAEVKAGVLAYMADTGIEDEQEARKRLGEEMEAGLEAATELLKSQIRGQEA